LKEIGRVAPNKPSKRRRNENATNSGSASTTRKDEMPSQTPAANGTCSTDGETPRSTLLIPTRAERRLTILAPLRESFPTPRGETSSQAEAEINGNISLPVNIIQQLQEFFQKQEAFNACVEESLQQRVEETGHQRQTRRLPKALTVSSLFSLSLWSLPMYIHFVEFSRSLSLAPKRSLQAAGKREGIGAGN